MTETSKAEGIDAQNARARAFAALHVKGDPLILYNIWDAGSAKAVAAAGAKALATGSWSVAAAQGYGDGQAIPLDLLVRVAARIVASTDLPLSVDFEGGYAVDPEAVAANVAQVIAAGAIGINFEDQRVGGVGLHPVAEQQERIAAVRRAADAAGVPLFINARTDLFLKERAPERQGAFIDEAIARGEAFRVAGASGFFVPGLVLPEHIGAICAAVALPVNVMTLDTTPPPAVLASLGVARISHGPAPYRTAMATLEASARAVLAAR